MRNRIAALTLVAFATAIGGPLEAAEVAAGTPVRVSIREEGSGKRRTFRGTVTGSEPGALTVKPDGETPAIVVRSDQVVRLEQLMKRGRRTKGAIIGASLLGGAMLGLFAWACSDLGCDGEDTQRAVTVVGGAATLGALLGAAASSGDRWKEIPMGRSSAYGTRPRLAVSATKGGGVAASVAFRLPSRPVRISATRRGEDGLEAVGAPRGVHGHETVSAHGLRAEGHGPGIQAGLADPPSGR